MSEARQGIRAYPVAVLWVLTATAFALFSGAFWAAQQRREITDPGRFLERAGRLAAEGDAVLAVEVLEEGMRQVRPPHPEPYEFLKAMYLSMGRDLDAAHLEPALRFYRALADTGAARLHGLSSAAAAAVVPARLASAVDQPVELLSAALSRALGAPELAAQWDTSARVGLLQCTSGAIRMDGQVGGTGVAAPVDLLVQSGGGSGDRRIAQLFVAGSNFGGEARGLYVVLLDAQDGRVLRVGLYDLFGAPGDAERLTEHLKEAPRGSIGLFAVRDDASTHLTRSVETQLLGFGLEREARINRMPALYGTRYSFAAIGVKGAPQGSALQAWSPEMVGGRPGHPVVCGVLRSVEEQP